MKIPYGILALALILICSAGCKKTDQPAASNPASGVRPSSGAPVNPPAPPSAVNTSDEDAIKAAIERHLQSNSGLNLGAMDTAINTITVDGDKAQANLTFSAKQGGNPMVMTYSLVRHGKDWDVVSSQPAGGQFAHPPLDKTHSTMPGNPQSSGSPNLKRFYKDDPSSAPADTSPAPSPTPKN